MNKELYVSSTPHETKVALMEDDQLAEVFFERDNEYTLAGSIYKGRVTRVLPGMQSAFVDIGLERDAFLYVSDFLELSGDEEEDEEFGAIPAPRGAIEIGKPQLPEETQSASTQTTFVGPDTEEESETFNEDFSASAEEQSAGGEEGESANGEDRESKEGARRWRGRRRRGGRRGRPDERDAKSEPTAETAAPVEEKPAPPPPRVEPRHEARPRADYGPPAGYTPIILPGESISKYRNLAQPVAETQPAEPTEERVVPAAVGDFPPPEANVAVEEEIAEEAAHLDQGFAVAESAPVEAPAAASEEESQPRSRRGFWRSRRKSAAAAESEAAAVVAPETTGVEAGETGEAQSAQHLEVPAPETAENPAKPSPRRRFTQKQRRWSKSNPSLKPSPTMWDRRPPPRSHLRPTRMLLRSSSTTTPILNGWPHLRWLPRVVPWSTRCWKTKKLNFSRFPTILAP